MADLSEVLMGHSTIQVPLVTINWHAHNLFLFGVLANLQIKFKYLEIKTLFN